MKWTAVLLFLIALLLIASGALAMSSDNYRLDWFTPLNGSGGVASSTSYAINFTVGQSAIGASASTSYGSCLGYWCGTAAGHAAGHSIYLPLMLREYP